MLYEQSTDGQKSLGKMETLTLQSDIKASVMSSPFVTLMLELFLNTNGNLPNSYNKVVWFWFFVFGFFLAVPGVYKSSRAWDQTAPQKQPEPKQWQHWILNALSHQGTPGFGNFCQELFWIYNHTHTHNPQVNSISHRLFLPLRSFLWRHSLLH